MIPETESPALDSLSTSEGRDLARTLRAVLDEVRFDVYNGWIRGPEFEGDYGSKPFPMAGGRMDVAAIKNVLLRFIEHSRTPRPAGQRLSLPFSEVHRVAFDFLVFGEAVSRADLDLLFGERRDQIDRFTAAGLFAQTGDGRIRLNGLSLASRLLSNGKPVYVLADTPPYFPSYAALERVYIGRDSYLLMDRILALQDPRGVVAEAGSGSGVQLIAALLRFSGLSRAVGLEIDARARNVSLFNAALNGLEDRFAVAETPEALAAVLAGEKVSLAFSNPPFMPVPDRVDILPTEATALRGHVQIFTDNGRPQISLRSLFTKAGWGGVDGLFVTSYFFNVLAPLMAPGSPLIVYSTFVGDNRGPSKVVEMARQRDGWSVTTEPLPMGAPPGVRRANSEWPSIPVEGIGLRMIRNILKQHPELQAQPQRQALEGLGPVVDDLYRAEGIARFFEGFAVIRSPAPSSHRSRRA